MSENKIFRRKNFSFILNLFNLKLSLNFSTLGHPSRDVKKLGTQRRNLGYRFGFRSHLHVSGKWSHGYKKEYLGNEYKVRQRRPKTKFKALQRQRSEWRDRRKSRDAQCHRSNKGRITKVECCWVVRINLGRYVSCFRIWLRGEWENRNNKSRHFPRIKQKYLWGQWKVSGVVSRALWVLWTECVPQNSYIQALIPM